jgi:6-phosphofructokinase 1
VESKNREMDVEVKYIDPEYLIRAGKGNALDSKMCS